jgi:hypothetical protein
LDIPALREKIALFISSMTNDLYLNPGTPDDLARNREKTFLLRKQKSIIT